MKITVAPGIEFEIIQTPEDVRVATAMLTEVQPARVVELGTRHYGYCALCHATVQAAEIWTYDLLVRPLTAAQAGWMGQGLHAVCADVHNEPWKIADVLRWRVDGPTVLWCDAGRRLLLAQQYARWLRVGDVLGVHDWGGWRLGPASMEYVLNGFEPLAAAGEDGSARYWRRVEIAQEQSP